MLSDLFPDSRQELVERFSRVRPHTPFTPPSEEGSIIFPGFDGGAEWGGQAVTPEGILFVNSNDIPWILTMVDASTGSSLGEEVYLQYCAACHGRNREGSQNQGTTVPGLSLGLLEERELTPDKIQDIITKGAGIMPPFSFLSEKDTSAVVDYLIKDGNTSKTRAVRNNTGTVYAHTGYNKWRDKHGYPAVQPPWGTLNAIDLNTGEYMWRRPFGIYPELVEMGFGVTGTENYGGPVATAGGVLFIAATSDELFRVFSQSTGKELFTFKLPAAGYATPATYECNGKQYVVIACGGGKLDTKSGDAYVAFALPD
jgi:quinoprotein glucose dehydrogenase